MKRYSKTIAQQCKYYEVEDIFEYMVETYINGNHSTFTRLFKRNWRRTHAGCSSNTCCGKSIPNTTWKY